MPQRTIFTADVMRKLLANGAATRTAQAAGKSEPDHVPVIKIFNPYGGATWIFTEIDENEDTLFGLCDLGFGTPELGYASKSEIADLRIKIGSCRLPLERDAHFHPTHPLSVYTAAANKAARITEDSEALAYQIATNPDLKHLQVRSPSAGEQVDA